MSLSVGGRQTQTQCSLPLLSIITIMRAADDPPRKMQGRETWLQWEVIGKWRQNTEPQEITMAYDFMINVC